MRSPAAVRHADVAITGRIEVRDLRKRIGDKDVLRGVSLTVEAAETVVILGPSGCGKSVLLKHLVGLLRPDTGEVRYDGHSLAALSEGAMEALRTQIGMAFQSSALFDSLTVADNVAFPLHRHRHLEETAIERIVAEKLEQVGLAGTERLMPEELSNGMRKRVGIARALALNPKVIFYDEPTAGLDPVTARTVDGVLKRVQRDMHSTAIVVTHDLMTAFSVADRIAVMQSGAFVELGTPEAIEASEDEAVVEYLRTGVPRRPRDAGDTTGPEAGR